VIVSSLLAPAILRRLGARRTLVLGFGVMGVAMVPLVGLQEGRTALVQLLVSFALMGAGLGAASVTSTQTGTEGAPAEHQGVAAGALTAAAQIGTALGLALAPLATSSSGTFGGYRAGFVATLTVVVAGLLLSLIVPGRASGQSGREGEPAEQLVRRA